MAFPYAARYGGGFLDLPTQTTAIDQAFLNAVEAALIALCAVAPSADQIPIWNNANSRFEPGKIADAQISAAAAIAISKLAGYPTDATKLLRGDGTWAVPVADGWTPMTQTLTYSSVDGPTGVVTTGGVDLTGVIPVGARLKFTQSATVKYFIVTAVSATTITFYGGTDYTLINAAITLPSYSLVKVPAGFNASPLKWTETLSDANHRTVATPTQLVWYNPGGGALSIALPIGCWDVTLEGNLGCSDGSNTTGAWATLSTANNSESDSGFTAYLYDGAAAGNPVQIQRTIVKRKTILLAAKTTHYVNVRTDLTTSTQVGMYGANNPPTTVRAKCDYL